MLRFIAASLVMSISLLSGEARSQIIAYPTIDFQPVNGSWVKLKLDTSAIAMNPFSFPPTVSDSDTFTGTDTFFLPFFPDAFLSQTIGSSAASGGVSASANVSGEVELLFGYIGGTGTGEFALGYNLDSDLTRQGIFGTGMAESNARGESLARAVVATTCPSGTCGGQVFTGPFVDMIWAGANVNSTSRRTCFALIELGDNLNTHVSVLSLSGGQIQVMGSDSAMQMFFKSSVATFDSDAGSFTVLPSEFLHLAEVGDEPQIYVNTTQKHTMTNVGPTQNSYSEGTIGIRQHNPFP